MRVLARTIPILRTSVLLREIEARLGLADRLSGCLLDGRDPERISHSYALMMRARIFAIACGHDDCDDLDALRFDPAFKLAYGRLPGRATGSIAAKPMGGDRRSHKTEAHGAQILGWFPRPRILRSMRSRLRCATRARQ